MQYAARPLMGATDPRPSRVRPRSPVASPDPPLRRVSRRILKQQGPAVSPSLPDGFTPLEIEWPAPIDSPGSGDVTREPVPIPRRLKPHVMAALLAVESADARGDRSTFVALPTETLASLAQELHCNYGVLADTWKRLRAYGLGPAYRFRKGGKFVPPPRGSFLCEERRGLLDRTTCEELGTLCARKGTSKRAVGFFTGGKCDDFARLRWLWLVRMPCQLTHPSYSPLVAHLVDLAASFLATHLGDARRALFQASLTRYKSLGAGCLSAFVNRYDPEELCGAPIHVDTRCVHGSVVVSLTDNDPGDQLSVFTSSDGAGCFNTTGMDSAGNAVCFGPGVAHGVRPLRRVQTRYSLNVFF